MNIRGVGFVVVICFGLAGCIQEGVIMSNDTGDQQNQLFDALAANGLQEVVDFLELNRAEALNLVAAENLATAPGSSRIGGTPDLPGSIVWPTADGKSLSFIAQIDLAEVAVSWPDSPLPNHGTLFFFYDAEQSVWGFDPNDRGKWSVQWFSGPVEQLRATDFPADLPDHARYRPRGVRSAMTVNYPDLWQIDLSEHDIDIDEYDALDQILEDFEVEVGTVHKLLGHPNIIQGEMEAECQLASNGLYCGDASGYQDPRAAALLETASEWQLLLQIDSDDDAGMMWGDLGRLYFWIRSQDLANRDFDKVWMILQCS